LDSGKTIHSEEISEVLSNSSTNEVFQNKIEPEVTDSAMTLKNSKNIPIEMKKIL